jgi:transketolase
MNEAFLELAKKYKNFVVLSSFLSKDLDMGMEGRSFSFGMGYANMLSAAAGFTVRGKVPLVFGLAANCVGRVWGQIRNDIAYPNLNVKIIANGVASEMCEDIALMRSLPNMKIFCPADYNEAFFMLDAMLNDYGPSYLRLPSFDDAPVFDRHYDFKFGQANVLKNGSDLCIFSIGSMLSKCLKVADMLEDKGFTVRVVNVSYLKNIDSATILKSADECKYLFSVEDHNVIGGLGDVVLSFLNGKTFVKKIGMQDSEKYLLDIGGIFGQIYDIISSVK